VKLFNFTLFKLTLCIVIGILIAYYFSILLYISAVVFLVLLLFTAAFFILYKSKLKEQTLFFSLFTLLTFMSLGVLSFNIHSPKNNTLHYSHSITDASAKTIIYKIVKRLKPNNYYSKYYVEILKVNNKITKGTALLQLKKDSLSLLKVDAIYTTSTIFIPVKTSQNPNQFNYKDYLEKQGVYHQFYSSNTSAVLLDNSIHTLNGYAAELRNTINERLEQHHFSKDELSIINALLLGQRQDITKSVYDSYTYAGATHILAVSGLHIGIILLILNLLFKPIESIKHGKFIKTVIIIFLLWSYAFIAGASASIIRATTMFSIVAIAWNLRRITNIYNTLISSVFIILLIKPLFLFDVGFQLSYSAVFAIVAFQPLIAKLWIPKTKFVNFFWQTFSVTLAAQFGVLPVSLYYFHQFPSLFWLSNLVVIPALSFILGLGILVIFLALLNYLPNWLADTFSYVIRKLTEFLNWVSSFEEFLIRDISFNSLNLITSILLVIAIYMTWNRFKAKNIIFLLIAFIGFQTSLIHANLNHKSDDLIIFHKTKQTLIALKTDNNLKLFNSDTIKTNPITTSYKVANFIRTTTVDSIPNMIHFKDKTLLIIDSLSVYKNLNFKPDYILLRQSCKLNLDRLIKTLQPQKIIADGSNYKSYVNRWNETCRHKKSLFHSTEKGAFVLKF
jgi:competence protein ComEC